MTLNSTIIFPIIVFEHAKINFWDMYVSSATFCLFQLLFLYQVCKCKLCLYKYLHMLYNLWCTRVVHKLLRQRNFTWMDTSTLFLSTCKLSITWLHSADRREHKKSITWRYAEHSDVANVTSADYNGVNRHAFSM